MVHDAERPSEEEGEGDSGCEKDEQNLCRSSAAVSSPDPELLSSPDLAKLFPLQRDWPTLASSRGAFLYCAVRIDSRVTDPLLSLQRTDTLLLRKGKGPLVKPVYRRGGNDRKARCDSPRGNLPSSPINQEKIKYVCRN